MTSGLVIISYEHIRDDYLRLYIQKGNQPGGFIDFIADKVNFNLSYNGGFFKGMECIGHIILGQVKDELSFLFRNKQKLAFRCDLPALEEINKHLKEYGQTDKSRSIKNRFFNEEEGKDEKPRW